MSSERLAMCGIARTWELWRDGWGGGGGRQEGIEFITPITLILCRCTDLCSDLYQIFYATSFVIFYVLNLHHEYVQIYDYIFIYNSYAHCTRMYYIMYSIYIYNYIYACM